ncbi:MAG: hypothetical protein ABL967_09435 [Bryobacteraceae bacterium]
MAQIRFLPLLAFLAAPIVTPTPSCAQTTAKSATSIVPRRTAEGKPDFGGMWEYPKAAGQRGGATVFDKKLMSPLKAGGEPFFEPRNGDPYHDEPRSFCFPSGFPSNVFAPYPVQLVQSKDHLVMVHEFMRMTRLIPMDGRPHREGIEPTYFGDSVAHWEGDTLVIDSTNFKRWSLDDWYYQDYKEYRMHSDAFHTIERIRYINDKTLSYNVTVDDPKIFSAPWSQEFTMTYKPEWEKNGLFEFVCEENNRCQGGQCQGK